MEARCLIPAHQPIACVDARGYPPDEDLAGPEAYPQWLQDSSPTLALYEFEKLLEENLDAAQFREAARDILTPVRRDEPNRRTVNQKLQQLVGYAWDAEALYENESPIGH